MVGGVVNDYMNVMIKTQAREVAVDGWALIKSKSFCIAKKVISIVRRLEKLADKMLIPKIYKIFKIGK